jgi:hypothetical protein
MQANANQEKGYYIWIALIIGEQVHSFRGQETFTEQTEAIAAAKRIENFMFAGVQVRVYDDQARDCWYASRGAMPPNFPTEGRA